MDEKTFATQFPGGSGFVKHTQPRQWAARMWSLFGWNPVDETDFSSMEALHDDVHSDTVLFWMKHMMRGLHMNCSQKRLLLRLMQGTNVMKFRGVTAEVPRRLMSGSMWTSSANAVLNLTIITYLNAKAVYPNLDPASLAQVAFVAFRGLVEGDDGIFLHRNIDKHLIELLGIRLKLETAPHFGAASFCGIVCCPRTLRCVMDPLKILRLFFCLPARMVDSKHNKQLALLRCKAMSLSVNLYHTPIVGALCHRVIHITEGLRASAKHLDRYKMDAYRIAQGERIWSQPPRPDDSSRRTVADIFGVPISEQLRIEKSLARLNRDQPTPIYLQNYTTSADSASSPTIGQPTNCAAHVRHPDVANVRLIGNYTHSPDPRPDVQAADKRYRKESRVAVPYDRSAHDFLARCE
jgi:hypothetical protein